LENKSLHVHRRFRVTRFPKRRFVLMRSRPAGKLLTTQSIILHFQHAAPSSNTFSGMHHDYRSKLQTAVSSGYTVDVIDLTYEAATVVFANGYTAYTSSATNAYSNFTSDRNFL
jgi:hypothetical protein